MCGSQVARGPIRWRTRRALPLSSRRFVVPAAKTTTRTLKASLPYFRPPGSVGLDGGSPWGPQFLAGTLLYQSEPPQGPRPEVHVPSTWRPIGGSEGPAVLVLAVVVAAGHPWCFGYLTAFCGWPLNTTVQRASGEKSPAPTPGGRDHPPSGGDL